MLGPDTSAVLRDRVAALLAESRTIELINLRSIVRALQGGASAAEGAVTKLLSALHAQHVAEVGMEIAGVSGIDGSLPELTHHYLLRRSLTIAGGTSEIGRNVISERLLGLPREPNLQ